MSWKKGCQGETWARVSAGWGGGGRGERGVGMRCYGAAKGNFVLVMKVCKNGWGGWVRGVEKQSRSGNLIIILFFLSHRLIEEVLQILVRRPQQAAADNSDT